MNNNISSLEKRETVKKDYDLIAEQYGKEFGTYIEDLDIYEEFEKNLVPKAKIVDLGAGTGRTCAYFIKKDFDIIGFDFSEEMKKQANIIHGDIPYIVDDMINVKNYFDNNSLDGVFAVYSLFHLPDEDLKNVISSVYDILKPNGIFLFSYQQGTGEEMVDEPYLEENGKNVLYMNYQNDNDINSLLKKYPFETIFKKEKVEYSDSAINSKNNITKYMLLRKI